MARRKRAGSDLLHEVAEIQIRMAEVVEQWAREDFEAERRRKYPTADTQVTNAWPARNGNGTKPVVNGKSAAA